MKPRSIPSCVFDVTQRLRRTTQLLRARTLVSVHDTANGTISLMRKYVTYRDREPKTR